MSYPTLSEISKTFAPGWFASVMGTGALALTTHSLGHLLDVAALTALGVLLHWFNLLLAAVLAVPWCLRWLRFREAALATLNHPIQANFYPTFSIALLVIAAQWVLIAQQPAVALGFWWLGAILTYLFSFAVLFAMFRGEQVGLDHVTPANFIPAVGLVVMPLAGGPLLGTVDGSMHEAMLLMNVLGLGAGSMMYVALLGITLFRKYLHKPAVGILTPTVWIHLAPIGVIPVSLANLCEHLPLPALREVAAGVMLLVWGFGVWWLVMAILLTLAAHRAGQLPFALSWWGFIFPVGAFLTETLRLYKLFGYQSLLGFGLVVWVLLVGLWLVTLGKTVRGVLSGDIFRPHP